ncbi:MAG: hypothetical protein JNJ77_19905 [Planctomycetia bacterium]|nr:hypothetical protein [Planctomycetia bacterium]
MSLDKGLSALRKSVEQLFKRTPEVRPFSAKEYKEFKQAIAQARRERRRARKQRKLARRQHGRATTVQSHV